MADGASRVPRRRKATASADPATGESAADAAAFDPPSFDLLVRDVLVLDGRDAPGVRGDVAVRDGRIVAIGDAAAESAAAETVDAAAFATIYARCGYGDTISRDPASLSYVAELGTGVWLFAIDSCRYAESAHPSAPITAGRVRAQTLAWLQHWLGVARQRGVAAIGTMHHGLIEHFPGQSSFFPEYLVEDREALAAAFAAADLPSRPYAQAVDPAGETLRPLVEADAGRGAAAKPVLADEDWVSLQDICRN